MMFSYSLRTRRDGLRPRLPKDAVRALRQAVHPGSPAHELLYRARWGLVAAHEILRHQAHERSAQEK